MTLRPDILALILACMLVTLLPRILPMIFVNRLTLPRGFLLWLQYIPVSVISALLFREILLLDGALRPWQSPHIIAGVASLLIAFLSKSIITTVLLSVLLFWLLGGF